ncbi:MAG: hybrid sensor histidine kinase/response regulator [Campylobacteraceae bacterium]|nr:hybrid sensor histidine kinase/response regulator [Campylobacteraceae bacterium]
MQIKILIVDDVQANLIALRALLEVVNKDFVIKEALNGEEALEQVLNDKIDLIILDIQMPIMDGFEVAKFLKSNNLTKDIPIIFLTAAFKSDDFMAKGFDLGAVDYLTKPINENLFINRISLYTKLIIERNNNMIKDKLMFQQSKMASMGEMLSNIAHQWRQPLSSISTTASGLSLLRDSEQLSEKDLMSGLDNIVEVTQYLSQTIDDFRTFFKQDKDKSEFNVARLLNKSISIIQNIYKKYNIHIISNFDKTLNMRTYKNELIQVFMTLLTNAKDALYDIEGDKLVFVEILSDADNIIIKIRDNADGIPLDIIDKIFDPYFTTKHQTQGTGIGLFIANEIIVNHMKAKITAKNVSYEHNHKVYIGAEFVLTLASGVDQKACNILNAY